VSRGARLQDKKPSNRIRDNGHKLEQRKSHMNMKKIFFTVRALQSTGTGCPERLWNLLL